jgi:transposase
MKNDLLTTLSVGIDVSSKSNSVCALNFRGEIVFRCKAPNNLPGAEYIAREIINHFTENFKSVTIALESTSYYNLHLASFLSTHESLLPLNPMVYNINAKNVSNYKQSYTDQDKTDPNDAFAIADYTRIGRIHTNPWKGTQFLALQRLTRHRLHLVETLTREKNYALTNIYLKFNQLNILPKDDRPFSNIFGATSRAVLSEFLSLEEITFMPLEDLVNYISKKSKNHFVDSEHTAKLLKKAARDSYRLDKTLYEPINTAIASSFSIIKSIEKQLKVTDQAIIKVIKGFNTTEYTSLRSIPGIGKVFAAGILAEIGSIKFFDSNDKLAKYAGITWRQKSSGNYKAEETHMTKTGNKYLRYYLIEAADIVRKLSPEYKAYYRKKFNEVPKHQHKRALALTARKLVRLIFALLSNNRIYSNEYVGSKTSQ